VSYVDQCQIVDLLLARAIHLEPKRVYDLSGFQRHRIGKSIKYNKGAGICYVTPIWSEWEQYRCEVWT
jgi:hypothetical protein